LHGIKNYMTQTNEPTFYNFLNIALCFTNVLLQKDAATIPPDGPFRGRIELLLEM